MSSSDSSDEEEDLRGVLAMQAKRIRDTTNPFDVPIEQFRSAYRFCQSDVFEIVEQLQPFTRPPLRNTAMPLELKVLLVLRFMAQGSYQKSVARDFQHPCSQQSVSKIIREIVPLISRHLMPLLVKFPTSAAAKQQVAQRFLQKYHVHGLIGLIDGTQICIKPPKKNDGLYREQLYVNRKHTHSINTLIIFDADLQIIYINAKYPGCTHDAFIWRNSAVKEHMVRAFEHPNHRGFYLFGDSGFANEPYLLVPFPGYGANPQERAFNRLQKSIRSHGERGNGILKNRFRCLRKTRVLYYAPNTSSQIINACAYLHNFANLRNVPEPESDNDSSDDEDVPEQLPAAIRRTDAVVQQLGRAARDRFIVAHNL